LANPVTEALILDFLEWLAHRPREYDAAIEAWRTSCPRLTIWEDAHDRGLVARADADGRRLVQVTAAGRALLEERGRALGAGHP
jgi:hypothetical protein